MIPTSGRTDVQVQWFSDQFIKNNEKVFEKISVGPGEVLMIVKDGKPSETYTEASVKLAGNGFLAKFREKLKGVNNQVLMADLRPFAVRIPFHGYTSDRTEIGGVMNVTVRVSKENIVRLSNLYTRDLITDDKWGNMMGKAKEVTQEDIARMMEYDTSLTVDASVLSKTASGEIRADLDRFNARVRNAVDSMTPVWANCGLAVDVVKVDIDQNAYEDAMRYRDQQSKAMMVMDANYEKEAHELELKFDYNILFAKKTSEEELAKIAGLWDQRDFILSKEMDEELRKIDQEAEVRRRQLASELESAMKQADIDRINSVSADEQRRRDADTDAYIEMSKIKNSEYVKDQDARRQIEIMQAQRDIEIERAFEDGKRNGKQLAEDDVYSVGYNKGYAAGLKEGATMSTQPHVVMQAPGYGYGAPPGYGYGAPPGYMPPQGGYDDRDRRYRDEYDDRDRRYRDDYDEPDRRRRDDDRRRRDDGEDRS